MTLKKTPDKIPPTGAVYKMADVSLIPAERIENAILLIRGHKVMLDSDLASLYGVQVKVLNQAVKRNLSRFPDDFMFCSPPKRPNL